MQSSFPAFALILSDGLLLLALGWVFVLARKRSPTKIVRRGIARFYQRDLDGAIADFSRAIELNPRAPWFYYARAVTEQVKKRVVRRAERLFALHHAR